MDDNRKSKIAALLLTLLWLVGTVLVMLYTHLHYEYPPKGAELAQLKQDTIMFGGEFVELGNLPDLSQNEQMELDTPTPTEQQSEQPDVEGDDLDDAGEPTPKPEPKPVVAAKQESPMKVKEKPKEEEPKKTGPAKSTKPEAKQEQVKRGKETTTPKTDRVKDAFGKSTGTTNSKTGSPDGNATTGAQTGKPGISGLVGYTLSNWKPYPHSRWAGTVTVKVRVNTRGKVIQANATGATGELASHPEVRRDCEQKALNCQFSVPKNTTTEGIGYITYRFI